MMQTGKRVRLDEYLVEEGHFQSARDALGPIIAGEIVVNGAVETKPGTSVRRGAEILVRGKRLRFASRGGYKLEHALARFGIELEGCVALDAGASTGGFTDCLLQAGCSKVYAVDVGYGQLRGRLAADARVVNLERTNISDLEQSKVADVEFCAVDLAYLSLRLAIPILRERCGPVGMVCLVKPLYEGLPEPQKGDRQAIGPLLEELLASLSEAGCPVSDLTPSPLIGGRGALEFLLRLEEGAGVGAGIDPSALVERAFAEFERDPPVQEPV